MRAAVAAGVTRDMRGNRHDRLHSGSLDRHRHAIRRLRKQAGSWDYRKDIKVGGQVASSSPHMCVPNGQRVPSNLGTCMYMHCRTIRRDETRWQQRT